MFCGVVHSVVSVPSAQELHNVKQIKFLLKINVDFKQTMNK